MPVRNTVCPHCGHEALVNVPDTSTGIHRVSDGAAWNYDTKSSCQECGKTFYASYTDI